MSAHTPGTWRVLPGIDNIDEADGDPSIYGSVVTDGEDDCGDWFLARVWSHGGFINGEANARLFAAAPEMLQALIDIRGVINHCRNKPVAFVDQMIVDEISTLDSAISKAEGK